MAAKKKAATAKKSTAKKAPSKKAATPKKPAPRADFGKPIDGFFGKQAPPIRAILEKLRKLVDETAPDAEASLKWGQPFYSVAGQMYCALGAHKAHVNLILAGSPDTFSDPKGLLEGEGKTGRRLVVKSADDIPIADVKRWLKEGAVAAKNKSKR